MEQGLHQGCVLASSLFGILFVVFRDVAYTRLSRTKTSSTLWFISERNRGRGEAIAGELALATSLWGMLYADDAGVVSQSPEQLR